MKKPTIGHCAIAICAAGLLLAAAWAQRGASGANAANGGGGRGYAHGLDDPPLLDQPPATIDVSRAKATREQNVKDATRLAELSEKVRRDLDASSSFTLSLSTLKEVDEINKLSKKLYTRLKSAGALPDGAPAGFDATTPGPPPKK